MTSKEHLTLAIRASGFFTILLTLCAFVPQELYRSGWDTERLTIMVFFLVLGLFLLRKGHWVTAFATADER